jgi:hypothetical protein
MMIVSLALMLQSAGPVAARGTTGCESGDGDVQPAVLIEPATGTTAVRKPLVGPRREGLDANP